MIVDRRFTYAEDDVPSSDVIVNMAHNAVVVWVRADSRSHDRQKLVTVASLGS